MGRSGGAGTAGGKMDASLVCVHESGGKVGHPSRLCNLIRKRRRLLTRKFPATHGSKIMGTTLHPSCVTTLANRLFGM
jgi:hypothetical protein